jgi:hypothetical protein
MDGTGAGSSSGADRRPPEIPQIAKWVLGISGLGILAISIIALHAAAGEDAKSLSDMSRTIFGALLPLFGTWVGTVLAYYFSSKNFESASQSVERMVTLTVDQKLGKLVVGNEMMRPNQITVFRLDVGQTPTRVLLQELRAKFSDRITRLPIIDANGVIQYIVHQSGLFKFVAEQALAQKPISALTLQDMVNDATLKNWISNIVYVPENASVADAKKKMEEKVGCQDLIVTASGSNTEPMLGWMTNVDIGRLSKA